MRRELQTRWERLLESAASLLPQYVKATAELSHAYKGIRRSELFFFYAIAAPLQPRRIVESGRARAQSTLVLARLFPQIPVVSLESDAASPDVAIAEERLRGCENVDCRFGDSLDLLPQLVEPGDIVLIDGPKDFRAMKLALRLLRDRKPDAVFVHDLWLGSAVRRFVDRHLPSALLSDEPRWVERHASLDSHKPIPPASSPNERRPYGATLGCFQAGADDYRRRLWQCTLAQRTDRLRATIGLPEPRRAKDFGLP